MQRIRRANAALATTSAADNVASTPKTAWPRAEKPAVKAKPAPAKKKAAKTARKGR